MLQCPNCGGALKFDIPTQKMKCESCGSMYETRDADAWINKNEINAGMAEEEREMTENLREESAGNQNEASADSSYSAPADMPVTIFRCRQCGGEIYSTDETAAGFCSYCGASTVLESRVSNEKKPEMLIPFKVTKDNCKEEYRKKMRKAIFAPSELKSIKNIDGFRGIYMPYWIYDENFAGGFDIKSSMSHRSGDYIITKHYSTYGNVDGFYNGLSFDASSSFSDEISMGIAPYDVKDIVYFSPVFLNGFYADTADVKQEEYAENAKQFGKDITKEELMPSVAGTAYEVNVPEPVVTSIHRALFPVWFLSYRSHNRVAYATVNGETGKVAADIPVSIRKYLIGVLILAIPVFLALNAVFTIIPKKLINIELIAAVISIFVYYFEMKKIVKKHDDKAVFAKTKDTEKNRGNKLVNTIIVMFVLFIIFFWSTFRIFIELAGGITSILPFLISAAGIAGVVLGIRQFNKAYEVGGLPGSIWAGAALIISLIVTIMSPADDYWYYGAIIISMAGTIMTLTDVIVHYNVLATRPLPQFMNHRGGDDGAF